MSRADGGPQTTGPNVVVCGAGAAGMAAALAAARGGAKVYLLEAAARIGGTVAHSLIHTLAGLFDSNLNLLNRGLAEELACRLAAADRRVRPRRIGRTWVLDVCPRTYQRVVENWVRREAGIHLYCQTQPREVYVAGGRLERLSFTGPQGTVSLRPQAVVDATGTAEVVRLVDAALVEDDPGRAAGGLIFTLRGVPSEAIAFPKGIAVLRSLRSAAGDGRLPPSCAHAWIDRGIAQDELYVKLFVPLSNGWRQAGAGDAAEALDVQSQVVDFLHELPEFRGARLGRTGCLGIRDGGRVVGEYTLTKDDVRQATRFRDAACRCAWPIEYWDPERGVSLEYLPEGSFYEIPLQALKVRGIENLWVAGKCLSADRYAQASARVVGSCWSMGEAAGRPAAGQ
jgi:hypothetical protein